MFVDLGLRGGAPARVVGNVGKLPVRHQQELHRPFRPFHHEADLDAVNTVVLPRVRMPEVECRSEVDDALENVLRCWANLPRWGLAGSRPRNSGFYTGICGAR